MFCGKVIGCCFQVSIFGGNFSQNLSHFHSGIGVILAFVFPAKLKKLTTVLKLVSMLHIPLNSGNTN